MTTADQLRKTADDFNTYWGGLTEEERFEQSWVMESIRKAAATGKYECRLSPYPYWAEPMLKARGFVCEAGYDEFGCSTPTPPLMVYWKHKGKGDD